MANRHLDPPVSAFVGLIGSSSRVAWAAQLQKGPCQKRVLAVVAPAGEEPNECLQPIPTGNMIEQSIKINHALSNMTSQLLVWQGAFLTCKSTYSTFMTFDTAEFGCLLALIPSVLNRWILAFLFWHFAPGEVFTCTKSCHSRTAKSMQDLLNRLKFLKNLEKRVRCQLPRQELLEGGELFYHLDRRGQFSEMDTRLLRLGFRSGDLG